MSGLSNTDFSRIAATPRRVDIESEAGSASSSGALKKAPRNKPRFKPRPKAEDEAASDKLPSGYRDRAQERRDRGDDDDDAVVARSDLSMTVGDINAMPEHLSAYLGGDVDHAHLVKGLDHLLLQRSRDAITLEEDQRLEQAMETTLGSDGSAPASSEPAASTCTFRTAMARKVFDMIGRRNAAKMDGMSSSSFLPGRMVFEFDTDSLCMSNLPTILRRSREDCPEPVRMVATDVPAASRARLHLVMESIRSGHEIKQQIAPVKLPVPAPIATVTVDNADSDDNIFSESDDDNIEVNRAPLRKPNVPLFNKAPKVPLFSKQVPLLSKKKTYFGIDEDESASAPPVAPSGRSSNEVVRGAVVKARETAGMLGVFENREQVVEEKPGRLTGLMDDYDDIDEYTAVAQGGYDSDDGGKAPDRLAAKAGATSGKALSATKLSKLKSKEKTKLNTQWQQINTIIEKKKRRADADEKGDDANKRPRAD